VWEALSSRQIHFNNGNEVLKYFPAEVAPFIGMKNWDSNDLHQLEKQVPANRSFSMLMAKRVELPPEFKTIFTLPLYQMYCPVCKPSAKTDLTIRELTMSDVPQMLALTEKTKPGPFYAKTILFGNYMGLFIGDELAAMTGERLKVNGYTEVSAICTNPDHLGKGYASYLISHACERIVAGGYTPFLHVRTDNLRAIEVYKRSGFEIRTDIHFAVFKKA
jgi:predicted GNAT family acetyltransferase